MAAGAGAFGPYPRKTRDGERYIIILRAVAECAGTSYSFASEGDAIRFRDDHRAAIEKTAGGERTIGEAIDRYAEHLAGEGARQQGETIRRCRAVFAGNLDVALKAMTHRRCGMIYDVLTKRKATRWVGSGEKRKLVTLDEPVSVNTHRGMLTHAKTFLKWCVEKRWIKDNPLGGVKPKGKLRRGKMQLRIDEARRWEAKALELAATNPGAVAALCALYLGLRASEIITRQVRDLDDKATVLVIDDVGDFEVKTRASRRTVPVGKLLRPLLLALTKDEEGNARPTDALLFGTDLRGRPHRRGWPLFWVKKICRAAGVPDVAAHSMRGLAETLAVQQVGIADVIAQAFGHSSEVAEAHYLQAGTAEQAKRRAGLKVIEGGKKGRGRR